MSDCKAGSGIQPCEESQPCEMKEGRPKLHPRQTPSVPQTTREQDAGEQVDSTV